MIGSSQPHPMRSPASRGGPLRPIDYIVCDVFTPVGLAGNQLAVFPDAAGLDDDLRGALAREMNYSESVFVTTSAVGADARLAIYTPSGEIPFAGHPVLGTAAALGDAFDREMVLETAVGPVPVTVRRAGTALAEVWMDQPWPESVEVDTALVRSAMGLPAQTQVAGYDNGARYALAQLAWPADVAGLVPDLPALGRLGHGVLCFAGNRLTWKARMFAPAIGVAEDPATGSAAGPLAVHLHSLGLLESGETIHIEQGAEVRRPSLLRACIRTEPEAGPGSEAGPEPEPEAGSGSGRGLRVSVGGHVVIVARGTFWLRPEDLGS